MEGFWKFFPFHYFYFSSNKKRGWHTAKPRFI
nr:MAG TPA: hypothetical protein [Caudoviricetes sp.]